MARRSNGEGTIGQRKDGLWTAALRLDDGNRKYFYGRTKREVQAKLNEARLLRQQGVGSPHEASSRSTEYYVLRYVRLSNLGCFTQRQPQPLRLPVLTDEK
jgi:hypothetical protein